MLIGVATTPPMNNTTSKTTRRFYQATTKSGVTDTFSSATRSYDFALVVEWKAVKESKQVEVPTERFVGDKWIPHMCYRTETTWHDYANGQGEKVYSFHTTEALARKALSAAQGKSLFNAYIVRTVRIK